MSAAGAVESDTRYEFGEVGTRLSQDRSNSDDGAGAEPALVELDRGGQCIERRAARPRTHPDGTRRRARARLVLISLLLAGEAAAQVTYRYIDRDGRVVFSDQPPPTGTSYTTIGEPSSPPPPASTSGSGVSPTPPLPTVQQPATPSLPSVPYPASQAPSTIRPSDVPVDPSAARDRREFAPQGEAARDQRDTQLNVPSGEAATDRRDLQIGVPSGERRTDEEAVRLNQ